MTVQGSCTSAETRARDAARRLMKNPKAPVLYEPVTALECHAAVDELSTAFEDAGETFREMVDNSRGGAESLSSDSFQGLSEIVQNANDAGATRVTFTLTDNRLEVEHNGRPVDLRDLRAMSVPWLTTKSDVAEATGRFGVGLSTLHAVAETFEVHSGNYHVRIGDPFLTNLDADPREDGHFSNSLLRVAFRPQTVSEQAFVQWYDRWDDSALMFLSHVRVVTFISESTSRTLRLKRSALAELTGDSAAWPFATPVQIDVVSARDGRRWMLATCEAASPPEVERARKRKAPTTPLGVAVPLFKKAPRDGQVYAGLPVVNLGSIPALINAQFDPVTARQGLLGTEWNYALAPLVVDLWDQTIRFLFHSRPKRAWRCVPLPSAPTAHLREQASETDRVGSALLDDLASRLRARADALASSVVLQVDGEDVRLTRLGVESPALTGVLTADEVAALSDTDFRLPDSARDGLARWRDVLRHWRSLTSDLRPEVEIRDALRLLNHPLRAVREVVVLSAVAVEARLARDLRDLSCIVGEDGRTHRPPNATSPFALTTSAGGLGGELGLTLQLHPEYSRDTPAAHVVREWLKAEGCLIDRGNDLQVLERLAKAGGVDNPVEEPFDDLRLTTLRKALEALDTADMHRLARNIGRAIFVDGYEFAPSGATVSRPVRPCDAYMPKRIETVRDGFFTAAGQTRGLVWVANRYVDVLKSDLPRGAGLGAQRFLRAMGVATTPRVVKHPALEAKYQSSRRRGLPNSYWAATPEWRRALADLDANYTLEDWESPDLVRVLNSIAADRVARRRRERANALIEVLGRSWRDLGDSIEVDAAWAHHGWNVRGKVRAWWLWRAASIPWLDNSEGTPTAPIHLRRRSTANIAVFGDTPETFLHKDVTQARPEVLNFLGVAQEPNTSDLIQRLRSLRENPHENTYAECATVYVALASRAADGSIGRTAKQLREQLSERGGLIRNSARWVSPDAVLRGPLIFGSRRDFTPSVDGTEALWRFLQIREPRVDDCLSVLSEIAKERRPLSDEDEAVVLHTLRHVDKLLTPRQPDSFGRRHDISNRVKSRLGSLPLWTSQGWVSKRPIYVVPDPQLAEGIGSALPVWAPGADPSQFKRLLPLLKVAPLGSSHVVTNHPDKAYLDDDATLRFQGALEHLKADLARNAPEIESSLTIPWGLLERTEIRVHPLLDATVTPPARKPITVPVRAKFETARGQLFLRDEIEIDRVDGVGRALATLFSTDERNLTYAWLAAVQKEREGQRARALELASERRAREAAEAQDQIDRLRSLQMEAKQNAVKGAAKKPGKRPASNPQPSNSAPSPQPSSAEPPRKPRVLVDIDSLLVTTVEGEIVNESSRSSKGSPEGKAVAGSGNQGKQSKRESLNLEEPDRQKAPPKPSTTYRAYSDEEKERLGLRAASRVLAGDAEALVDIRNQRNVGADAIDDLGKFYELKVFGNEEGDTITLQPSQIARAMSEPNFFLVVVSNLEGQHARPKVRVIVDPLRQLTMTKESKVKFSGLQEARGLVFNLDRKPED